MFTRNLLVGISTLAMAASAASAQNSISSSGTGNTTACNNATAGAVNNTCTIVQVGNNDFATITQTTSGNRSEIRQTGGNGNIATHDQGATGAPASTVTAHVAVTNQNGSSNDMRVVQNGARHNSEVNQSQNFNNGYVRQLGGVAATAGTGGNFTRFTQNGLNTGGAVTNFMGVEQNGNLNTVTTTQIGTSNNGSIVQGSNVDAAGAAPVPGVGFFATTGNSNTATATQQSNNTYAQIVQVASGTAADQVLVQNNQATISMANNGATVQGQASITQRSSGNRATAIVNDGGTGANSGNFVTITQTNPTAASSASANNFAFASLSQGRQMNSTITQTGPNNYADVTLTSGVAGTDPAPAVGGRDGGNASTVNQLGTGGSTAYVSAQAPRNSTAQGFGNDSTINQTATIAYLASTGTSQAPGTTGAGEPANINGSRGQYATVWQQGRYGQTTINQSDVVGQTLATQTYGTGASAVYGRARAGVYQAGILNTTTVTQTGDNYADVTQGLLGAGSRSVTSLVQTDAGDTSVAGPPDGFGNPTTVPVRAYNRQLVTQYGDDNSIDANQNTINGYQSLFQRQATSFNIIDARQGIGSSGAFNGATGNRAAPASPFLAAAPAVGAATSGLSATIEQGGTRNYVRAYQDGTNLTATVTQLGSGGAGAGEQNSVIVAQQGTNNRATATQSSNVGRSAAALATNPAAGPVGGRYTHAGGALSAEIVILQSGGDATVANGNRALAEQRGKGQYARIEQQGLRNVAGILQEATATNAVAAISQTGNDNSYYIVQTTAGQYIDVTQVGSNNTTVTQSGGSGGSAGFTPPAGFPTP